MGQWWSRFRRWRERGAAAPDVPPRVVSASRWNELVNREADLATLIQQTYLHMAVRQPLTERLHAAAALLRCCCTAPLVIAVWEGGQLHEYRTDLRPPHPDRRRFADRVAAGQQRRPTVVSLPNPQLQNGYTECLILPLWVGQRHGGWIEIYWVSDSSMRQRVAPITSQMGESCGHPRRLNGISPAYMCSDTGRNTDLFTLNAC